MTINNKILAQYLLSRNIGGYSGLSGYYYDGIGSDYEVDTINYDSIQLDETINIEINYGVVDDAHFYADGSMILVGYFTEIYGQFVQGLVKLDKNGLRDWTLDLYANDEVRSILVREDGKILICGNFTSINQENRGGIALINEDGTLSSKFSNVTINQGSSIVSMVLQDDDKIIVSGGFTTINGVSRGRIARLNGDDTLDLSFNPDANGAVPVMKRQKDGKILIGGYFTTVGGNNHSYIARLNVDGTVDTEFLNNSLSSAVFDIGIQSDDSIIISGYFDYIGQDPIKYITKLDKFGLRDQNFYPPDINYLIRSLAIQDDDKILICGNTNGLGGVERLNSDGTIDKNFKSFNCLAETIKIMKDNRIFISINGSVIIDGSERTGVVILKETVDNAPYKLAYTTPYGKSNIINAIFVANQNNYPVYYDIAIVPYADSAVSYKHHIIWDDLLDANGFTINKDRVTLSAGDKIYVYSSTDEAISFNIIGSEITE